MELFFNPLDRLDWPSDTTEIENTCTLDQLENHCSTVDMPSTIENMDVIHNSSIPTCQDQQQHLMILGGPIRHENLFAKFEALLNMCKDHAMPLVFLYS
jgi:hypothetical protein